MAYGASQEMVVGTSAQAFVQVLLDYDRYAEFVPNVPWIRAQPAEDGVLVEYVFDIGITSLRYSMLHRQLAPGRVCWSLVESDVLARSDGQWEVSDDPAGARVRYQIEVEVQKRRFVPRAIVDGVGRMLTGRYLPRFLDSFKQRAELTATPGARPR